MNFFIGIIFAQIIYYSPPDKYVTHEQIETYFASTLSDVSIAVQPIVRSLEELESEMNEIFIEGYYVDLKDSLVIELLKKNENPSPKYAEKLKEYPKSYHDIFLRQGFHGNGEYNYVLILNKKGKIENIEKWGYGM